MSQLRVGSLFSGIGGLELGLERAGMRTVFQVEIDDYATKVLQKHWPHVPKFRDIRQVGGEGLPECDVLCGGFPCQDLSTANAKRKTSGIHGAKSGLWSEFLRIVREVGPATVLVENVACGWRQWVPIVRRDIWGLGYASVPIRLRAQDFGAPHGRERVFIVAYAHGDGKPALPVNEEAPGLPATSGLDRHWRSPPPGGFRMDDGIPRGMGTHQLRGYGNSVMPQMAEYLGRLINAHHEAICSH